jgi:tRNA pseudouridine32 synthase/23S rRNA pseudouridine746 synthase
MGRSRLYLPKLSPAPSRLLDHLASHFPNVAEETWRERMARGKVTLEDGTPLRDDATYQHGLTIYYARETTDEPEAAESETILHQDSEILVADKPHGMPVTPAGDYVERSLLFRLQKSTGIEALSPLHRLDRDTAGLVLFSVNPRTRGAYQQLFEKKAIEREYLAVGRLPGTSQTVWHLENRVDAGNPWFTQRIVEGIPNAETTIELLEARGDVGLFRLRPKTGKKHQLRLHMASIGAPIVGDPFYPQVREKQPGGLPLQLLAYRLSFLDPTTEAQRTVEKSSFFSIRTLSLW